MYSFLQNSVTQRRKMLIQTTRIVNNT